MSKFKVGDKIRFKNYDEWRHTFGIGKKAFEQNYSYDLIYTVTYSYKGNVSVGQNPRGFTFKEQMLEHVKETHFDDDLFDI